MLARQGFILPIPGKVLTCYGKVGVFFSLAGGVFTDLQRKF